MRISDWSSDVCSSDLELFDEIDPIEEAYRLEVSSPGIDRPLTRPSVFADWIGHEARISLVEPQDGRKQFTGTLKGVEVDVITFSDRKLGDLSIPFDNVHGAKLMLTDALINATMTLSTEGADDIQTEG